MKAIVFEGFGSPDILRYQEIETPRPAEDEVLIKVLAASINPLDWKTMEGGPRILRWLLGRGKSKLKHPGVDVAGIVESVGSRTTQFKPGDPVFGTCSGAFAEYAISRHVTAVKSALVVKPENVTFAQAAAAPVAALTALQGLRDKGGLRSAQRVLINGAAGGVGTFAVQIAKALGAIVTAVCSTPNVDLVRSIGADDVVDYTQQDFTQRRERYDVILDCVGNHSFPKCRRVLTPHGIFVGVGAPGGVALSRLLAGLLGALVVSLFVRQKFTFFIAKMNREDLALIGEFLSSGKIRAVIDRHYRLKETTEAFRYAEKGHARGKVIIEIDNGASSC